MGRVNFFCLVMGFIFYISKNLLFFENNRGLNKCPDLRERSSGLVMQSVVSSSGNSLQFQLDVPEGYAKSLRCD